MKRTLVLGGGGGVGVAWEAGMLAGLLDGGVDLRDAHLIVGTSAGSVIGTHIAFGRDPREVVAQVLEPASERQSAVMPQEPSHVVKVFQTWGSFDEMTEEHCAQVGRLALEANTVPEEDWLAGFAANGWTDWPDSPLLVVAVDCESGAYRAFARNDGVPIERAVAASCAVPGLFPPVSIDGRRYTDGGVRSWTSADLVLAVQPDITLIIAPAGVEGQPGVRGLAAKQVQREMEQLRSAGVDARLITLDDAALPLAQNLMDRDAMAPVATAGQEHGRRIAAEIGAWWQREE